MGAANLGLAVGKGFALGGAVAGLGATGICAPAAAVLAVYGTVSISDKVLQEQLSCILQQPETTGQRQEFADREYLIGSGEWFRNLAGRWKPCNCRKKRGL